MSRRFYIRLKNVDFSKAWSEAIPDEPRPLVRTIDGEIDVDGTINKPSDVFVEKDIKFGSSVWLYTTSQEWSPRIKVNDDVQVRVKVTVKETVTDREESATITVDLNYGALKPESHTFESTAGGFKVKLEIIPDFIGRRIYTGLKVTRSVPDGAVYNGVGAPAKIKLRTAIWSPRTGKDSVSATNRMITKKYPEIPAEAEDEADALFPSKPGDVLGESPYLRARFLLDMINAADDVIASRFKDENEEARVAGEQILHLFVAPEWYFRRGNRPYSQSDMINLVGLIGDLINPGEDDELHDDEYKPCRKWLLVPGSIFWGIQLPSTGDRWHVFNSVPIFWKGRFFTYMKRNEADIASSKKRDASQVWGMYGDDHFGYARLSESSRDAIYSIGTITFGLEVCRDHMGGRLLRHWGKQPDEQIDVHILTAADVVPSLWRKTVRDGGVFVYCDGASNQRKLSIIKRDATLHRWEALHRTLATQYDQWANLRIEQLAKHEENKKHKEVLLAQATSRSDKSRLKKEIKQEQKRIDDVTKALEGVDYSEAQTEYLKVVKEEKKTAPFEEKEFDFSIYELEDLR